MLGQRRPHDLPLTLANSMNDVVAGTLARDHPEIMHHPEGFDFVPGNRSLSAVEVSLVNVMSRETVLRQYVDSVKQDYDYVLLDCRPSLGMLVINALAASDYVLIPVQADYLAAEDMTELVGTVQSIKRQINPRLKIGGVFLTMANETNPGWRNSTWNRWRVSRRRTRWSYGPWERKRRQSLPLFLIMTARSTSSWDFSTPSYFNSSTIRRTWYTAADCPSMSIL